MYRIGGPRMPYDATYHFLLRIDKIRAIVAAEHPDVLEIHSPYMAALGCLAARRGTFGIRTMQWHSDFIDTYRATLERAVRVGPLGQRALGAAAGGLWSWVRYLAEQCSAVLVASRTQRDKLVGHGIPGVRLLPFGIERDVFSPKRRSDDERKARLRGQDGPLFVAIGRFAIEKQWDVVLDAFFAHRKRHPGVLVLFGDGPERARMEQRCAGRTDVFFEGFVKDREALARALASGDFLLHGCAHETFGLSIAEALASGLPVVVPDQGGASELGDPRAAETYASGDPVACAAAIGRIIVRPQDTLRQGVHAVAQEIPSVQEQFQAQIELYRELLGRGAVMSAGRT